MICLKLMEIKKMLEKEIEKFLQERKKIHEAHDLRTIQDINLFIKISEMEFAKTRSSMIVDRIRFNRIREKKNTINYKLKSSSSYARKIEYLQKIIKEAKNYKKRLQKILTQ